MVMRLFAPQFLVVWAFIASALAVHFRRNDDTSHDPIFDERMKSRNF